MTVARWPVYLARRIRVKMSKGRTRKPLKETANPPFV